MNNLREIYVTADGRQIQHVVSKYYIHDVAYSVLFYQTVACNIRSQGIPLNKQLEYKTTLLDLFLKFNK